MSIACIDFTSEFYLKSQKLRNQVLREPLGQNLFDEDLNDEINQIHFVALEKAQVLGVWWSWCLTTKVVWVNFAKWLPQKKLEAKGMANFW